MKTLVVGACVAISIGLAAINPADAKGCIKGAMVAAQRATSRVTTAL
jgi:hypothetical protein